jgi:hypothetical protein
VVADEVGLVEQRRDHVRHSDLLQELEPRQEREKPQAPKGAVVHFRFVVFTHEDGLRLGQARVVRAYFLQVGDGESVRVGPVSGPGWGTHV